MDIGTPVGLAFASGINAYLPLLSFAIAARFLHLYKVNPNFTFVTSNWFMIALLVLTIADFVVDKFPVIDHTWDAVHTVIRPIMGALIAAASYGQFHIPGTNTTTAHSLMPQALATIGSSSHMLGTMVAAGSSLPAISAGLVIMIILGGLLAAMSHTAKASTRLLSTATTAGFLNIVLSFSEDVLVIILVLLSLFVPIVILILVGLFIIAFGPLVLRVWRWRLRRNEGL